MISTALKHQTWSCMQPMLMGSWYVKYLLVNLNNTPISGRYCCSQIQHPNHTPLASHSFPRIIFLTIIWTVSLCWCLFIPVTTIMHWLKLPSCPAISYFSPSDLSLQIGYCHWWLSKEFLTTKVWSFHRSFILCLKHMASPLLPFVFSPLTHLPVPFFVVLVFQILPCNALPPHDIFSWLYKLTGSKNCVLTAFYQKVILLSLSAPNGEISFFQYNQIYCVFNMVLKFPDLFNCKASTCASNVNICVSACNKSTESMFFCTCVAAGNCASDASYGFLTGMCNMIFCILGPITQSAQHY